MNGLRKFAVALFLLLFSLSLMSFVLTNSVVRTVGNPKVVKSWLSEGEFYSAINETFQTQQKTVTQGFGDVTTEVPEIQKAISDALSPQFLQTSSENIIDGLYRWLNGDVKKPDFQIDITSVKKVFAQKAGEYAKSRYLKLPVCPANTLPNATDIFNVSCRVIGYNVDPIINQFVIDIQNNNDFIPGSVITADNLNELQGDKDTKKAQEEQINFDELSKLPIWYRRVKLLNNLLFLSIIIFGILAVLMSASRKNGVKRLAKTAIFVGVSYLIVGLSVIWASQKIQVLKIDPVEFQSLQESAQKIGSLAIKNIGNTILVFAIIYILLSVSTLVIFYYLDKKSKKTDESSDKPVINEDETKNSLDSEKEDSNPEEKVEEKIK